VSAVNVSCLIKKFRWLALKKKDSRILHQAMKWKLKSYRKINYETAKEELDGHYQTRSEEHRHYLERSPKNWRQTKQNGVNVWPNAFTGMRDELRSKVKV